jgi:hypothetical protein
MTCGFATSAPHDQAKEGMPGRADLDRLAIHLFHHR